MSWVVFVYALGFGCGLAMADWPGEHYSSGIAFLLALVAFVLLWRDIR